MKSKLILGIIFFSILIIIFFILRFIVAGPEDAGIKENGAGVRLDNPSMPSPSQSQMLGGDRDEHGCIGSAGYSWCEVKTKCLRPWEEKCLPAQAGE